MNKQGVLYSGILLVFSSRPVLPGDKIQFEVKSNQSSFGLKKKRILGCPVANSACDHSWPSENISSMKILRRFPGPLSHSVSCLSPVHADSGPAALRDGCRGDDATQLGFLSRRPIRYATGNMDVSFGRDEAPNELSWVEDS